VVINGRFLGQRVTGVQRYARETLACLDALVGQGAAAFARWQVAVPAGTASPGLAHIPVVTVGHRQGHAWEQMDLAWHARHALLLGFGFTGPALLRRQIITIHDGAVLRMPQAYRWTFRLWYRALVGWVARRAPLVLGVSAFAAAEAQACFHVPPARLRTTTEGWQHLQRIKADDTILGRHDLRHRPFVLAVSSATPNKNFAAIGTALARLGSDAPLCVVAGGTDGAIFAQAVAQSPRLLPVGYVSDGELKALYEHAACFVFPSFYEGFGIPPLEAMASGCAVLASTAPAVREVCGDAALYFDPHQPAELAERLREFFADPALRARLVQRGRARAAHYSWEAGARLHLGYVREALGQPLAAPATEPCPKPQ
jgi:glycosyltransferase involved in cell wall biosynthesis